MGLLPRLIRHSVVLCRPGVRNVTEAELFQKYTQYNHFTNLLLSRGE